MGGSFDMPYYTKDTNFGFDPEAASIVLIQELKLHSYLIMQPCRLY